MVFHQKEFILPPFERGIHIITPQILTQIPEIEKMSKGLLHVFLKHTSASLTLNENADPTVREDMEQYIDQLVPENQPYFKHTYEGPDDMPAHIKTTLMGSELTIPVAHGALLLGTWQGIYLCEHRNHGGARSVVLTLFGMN